MTTIKTVNIYDEIYATIDKGLQDVARNEKDLIKSILAETSSYDEFIRAIVKSRIAQKLPFPMTMLMKEDQELYFEIIINIANVQYEKDKEESVKGIYENGQKR